MTIRFTRSLALYLNDLQHAPPPTKMLDENVNGRAHILLSLTHRTIIVANFKIVKDDY